MRPVTKGNPPNYRFYTNASETNTYVTFPKNEAVAVVHNPKVGAKIGKAVRLSMRDIMDEILDVTVLGQTFPNPLGGRVGPALRNMRDVLARRYRAAHPDLVTMLGNFCSFCELPLPNSYLDVEHRAAKAPYPTFFLWWQNFLLACTGCNSAKGDDPDRATTTAWAAKANPSENELVNEIKSHYYWADLDDGTYRIFRFRYYYDTDTVAPTQMDATEYPSRDNVLIEQGMDTVRANVWEGGAMHLNKYVECRLYANGGGTPAPPTLTLTGIGQTKNERVMYRTTAWLACCAQLKRLFASVARVQPVDKDAQFADEWATVLEMARTRGFYSTFLDVLEETGFPAGVTAGAYANLGEKFVFDTNPANNVNPLQTVPGTNYTEVP